MVEPVAYLAGEVLEAHHRRVEGFVGVQVDADAGFRRDREEHVGRFSDRSVRFEVRASADQVGSGIECVA